VLDKIPLLLSQISVGTYSDNQCSSITGGLYYTNACTPGLIGSGKFVCSSDGTQIQSQTFASKDCSGSSISISLYTSGACTSLTSYSYIKATCGGNLPTNNIVFSRKGWGSTQGCSVQPQSVTYAFGGCFQIASGIWSSSTCNSGNNNAAVTSTFSDSQCQNSLLSSSTPLTTCAVNSYSLQCGFVSSSSFMSINLLVLLLVFGVYFNL